MAKRTMFYWSKMYSGPIKPGDTYDKLKKCITINIVDFKCIRLKKLYSSYHKSYQEHRIDFYYLNNSNIISTRCYLCFK